MKMWYNNHRGGTKNRRVFKFQHKISLRNVVAHFRGEDVRTEVEANCPNAKPGSPEYLSHYQRALTKIVQSLTNDEREEYEAARQEWQDTTPPAEIQRKYVLLLNYLPQFNSNFLLVERLKNMPEE